MAKMYLETNISLGEGPEFITSLASVDGNLKDFIESNLFKFYVFSVIDQMIEIYEETDGEGGDYAYLTVTVPTENGEVERIFKISFDAETDNFYVTSED